MPPPIARPGQVAQAAQRPTAGLVQLLQMSRRGRQKKNDDDEDYEPPGARRQLRFTFPVSLRSRLIKRTAVLHVRGFYVCPRCGRPIARRDRSELPFYYRSKKKKRLHKTSSVHLDHYPSWAGRLAKLTARRATHAEIRAEYLRPDGLRVLCKRCNESHRYENRKINPVDDDDDDGYHTPDDEPEMSGKYQPFRKDDGSSGGGGSMVPVK
ncbi:GH-E family nuclease [Pseudoduganella sp. RAF53_2]|uniref:GH-E family nuclease n=1 Tax=unclassified Pseudoduganella TaxID=2637179 RepID=UPI003F973BB3